MTTSFTNLFDAYSLRARLYPALITVLPAALTVFVHWELPDLRKLWLVFVAVGGLFLVAQLVRGQGIEVELQLIDQWGGMPTTHALRAKPEQPLRQRRREQLQRVSGIVLPTQADEIADPSGSDERYHEATRVLISMVRDAGDRFPRVQEENINYGFRRNLLGVKPLATATLLIAAGASVITACRGGGSSTFWLILALDFVLFLFWIGIVNSAWVWQAGDKYAERLLETMDILDGPESGSHETA